jgi:hypothetical protein
VQAGSELALAGAHAAAGDVAQAGTAFLDHAESGDPQAWIDAENSLVIQTFQSITAVV